MWSSHGAFGAVYCCITQNKLPVHPYDLLAALLLILRVQDVALAVHRASPVDPASLHVEGGFFFLARQEPHQVAWEGRIVTFFLEPGRK